jgi:hypothetical protein
VVQFTFVSTKTEHKPLNIIQALSAGFDAVTRAPQVMLLPIVLDLFLWLGPRLSARPLIEQLLDLLKSLPQPQDAAMRAQMMQTQALLDQAGQQFNLFAWLSPTLIGVPSMMASMLSDKQPWAQVTTVWEVNTIPVYLVLFVLFSLLGLGLSALYWSQIAQTVLRQLPGGQSWLAHAGRIWWRLILLVLMMTALAALIGMPIFFAATLAALFSPMLGQFIVVMWPAMMLWIALYLAFSIHGLALREGGFLEAVQISLLLMRAQFLPSFGLLLLGLVIYFGLDAVWTLPAGDSWLRAGGILGSAFIGSGLWCATAFFYLDRAAATTADRRPPTNDQPLSAR